MSNNVVDISRRFKPHDKGLVYTDARGHSYFKFLFDYQHEGNTWGLEIWAKDEADAAEKMKSIQASAKFVGRVLQEVPQ